MDRIRLHSKISELIKKHRYALLVLLIGLILMTISFDSEDKKESMGETVGVETDSRDISGQLEQILSMIEGAGEVKVLLTVASGEQTVYQTDVDRTNGENSSEKSDTVIVTDGDRAQSGLVQQINPAKYLGAIIVCEGGDKAEVRLAIAEAVARVTGLGTNQISVLKMK